MAHLRKLNYLFSGVKVVPTHQLELQVLQALSHYYIKELDVVWITPYHGADQTHNYLDLCAIGLSNWCHFQHLKILIVQLYENNTRIFTSYQISLEMDLHLRSDWSRTGLYRRRYMHPAFPYEAGASLCGQMYGPHRDRNRFDIDKGTNLVLLIAWSDLIAALPDVQMSLWKLE